LQWLINVLQRCEELANLRLIVCMLKWFHKNVTVIRGACCTGFRAILPSSLGLTIFLIACMRSTDAKKLCWAIRPETTNMDEIINRALDNPYITAIYSLNRCNTLLKSLQHTDLITATCRQSSASSPLGDTVTWRQSCWKRKKRRGRRSVWFFQRSPIVQSHRRRSENTGGVPGSIAALLGVTHPFAVAAGGGGRGMSAIFAEVRMMHSPNRIHSHQVRIRTFFCMQVMRILLLMHLRIKKMGGDLRMSEGVQGVKAIHSHNW